MSQTAAQRQLCFLSAIELASSIRQRAVSPVEVLDAILARIELRNPRLNAFVTILAEESRKAAEAAERMVMSVSAEDLAPLHGVPVAIKDLSDFKTGVRATFGSRPFADFVPTGTSVYVQRLEDAGAIVIGKTNSSEFGHKGTTDNRLFGPTRNPFADEKNAGGSSGGSAAAVADGMAFLAQGSDAGGSIRIPAAFCGVYGLKPSYGRIPMSGRPDGFMSQPPFISVGPLARTVADAALMLEVMAGPHTSDPMSLPAQTADYRAATSRPIGGLRIAYSPDLDVFPVEASVERIVRDSAMALREGGARVDEVRIGLSRSQNELAAVLHREMALLFAHRADLLKTSAGIDLRAHREELTPEFAEMIDLGDELCPLVARRDDVVRTEVFDALQQTFCDFDLLITPTTGIVSIDNGIDGRTTGPSHVDGCPVNPLIGWALTYPVNFTGHPAASVPAGRADGLPVGVQLIGPRFGEETVIAVSAALERLRPWHDWLPVT